MKGGDYGYRVRVTEDEKTLESDVLLGRRYGHIQRKLENRLSELHLANSLADISSSPPPRRHKLIGDMEGRWSIDVSVNWRIIIEPIGDFDDNDLTSITSIRIVDIKDDH